MAEGHGFSSRTRGLLPQNENLSSGDRQKRRPRSVEGAAPRGLILLGKNLSIQPEEIA